MKSYKNKIAILVTIFFLMSFVVPTFAAAAKYEMGETAVCTVGLAKEYLTESEFSALKLTKQLKMPAHFVSPLFGSYAFWFNFLEGFDTSLETSPSTEATPSPDLPTSTEPTKTPPGGGGGGNGEEYLPTAPEPQAIEVDISSFYVRHSAKTYGNCDSFANPPLSRDLVAGWPDGVDAEQFSVEVTRALGENAGRYTIYAQLTALTDNYTIVAPDGHDGRIVGIDRFEILPRPLTIMAQSASKTYDSRPLVDSRWTIISGELLEGHQLFATVTGSQTAIGSSANILRQITIMNMSEQEPLDVTANYVPNFINGMLTVVRAPLVTTPEIVVPEQVNPRPEQVRPPIPISASETQPSPEVAQQQSQTGGVIQRSRTVSAGTGNVTPTGTSSVTSEDSDENADEPGSDEAAEGFVEPEIEARSEIPVAIEHGIEEASEPSWALMNLIIAAVSAVIALALAAYMFIQSDKTRNLRDNLERMIWGIGAIVIAAITVVLFLIVETMGYAMVIVNYWTIVKLGLLALQVGAIAMLVHTLTDKPTK